MINVNDYQVGGSLPVDTLSYVVRSADRQLYQALKQGEFCYILDARQMGKSSLMVRMMHHLRQNGYCCAAIDMTRIGGERITPEQWYKGLIVELLQGFNLFDKFNLKNWWGKYQHLSPVQILSLFIEEVLLGETVEENPNYQSHLAIFCDEIDNVLSLDFPVNDFFALIRFCYNQRSLNAKYKRLTFVLLGVATPSNLINDYRRTPFNIGRAIQLNGFSCQEAQPLLFGLQKTVSDPELVLKEILYWTNGQPFLTQKICYLVSIFSSQTNLKSQENSNLAIWIKRLIQTQIINNWQIQDEPEHLKTIRDRILSNELRISSILTLYQQILCQESIPANNDNNIGQQELLLSGLIIKEKDRLKVRNLIYQQVFNLSWLETQLSQLRPYAASLQAWQKSNCTDNSRLLRGRALEDAQEWSLNKNLSNLDYYFLASSEKLNRKEIQQALEAERAKDIEIRLLEKQKTAKLQRYLLLTLSLAFSAVLGFGIIAYEQYHKANLNEIEALINYSQALFASNKRLEALKTAIEIEQKWQKLNHIPKYSLDRHYRTPKDIDAQIKSVLRQTIYGVDEYNRLSGHTRTIFGVDISSNGAQIVTGGEDTTIKIWQSDGTLITTLTDHKAAVWDVKFSPDGRIIASASRDRTVKLWHQDSGESKTLTGHQDEVLGVGFSPDGRIIASASRDKTVKLWQLNGKLIDTLEGHQSAVWQATFSPDGQEIATVSEDKTIKIWQLNSTGRFQLARTLQGHTREIRNVIYCPDGKIIASASHDHTVKLWERNTGKLLHTLERHRASVIGIAFSLDGKLIATSSWDNTIKIWNLQGDLLKTINVGEKRIWDIALAPNDNTMAVVSEKRASLIKLDNPFLKVLRSHSEPVIDVAFHPDGNTIASVSDDHTVKFWDRQGSLLSTFKSQQDSVLGIDWSPNGKELVSGHWNGALNFLEAQNLAQYPVRLNKTIYGHKVGVWRVAYSPDKQLIATGSEDMTAKIWDRQGNLITTLEGHQDVIRGIAISPDSKLIATASYDRTFKLWNVEGDLLASITDVQNGMGAIAFSPDNNTIATGYNDGSVKLWQIEQTPEKIVLSLRKTLTSHVREIRKLAFSSNSELIATASGDHTVKLWHRDGKLLKTLYGHNEEVWSVDFSPDGTKVVSGSEDRTLIIWDIKKMSELNLLAAGCNQIKDYLRTNSKITPEDRSLCQEFESLPKDEL